MIREFYRAYMRYWVRMYSPPVLIISTGGECTTRPVVCVSAARGYSTQGVYSFDDADPCVRNAKALMYARGLADIMKCKVIDRRYS